jgi:glycosyltransferase involved in cell wall biosynthesis
MKVLVDARELTGRPTGVGRYLLELLRRWTATEATRAHELVLCAHDRPLAAQDLACRVLRVGGGGGTLWEQWTFARAVGREAPDVIFAPAYTAPLTGRRPVVLTVHDLSFVAHPEWFSFREGLRRRLLTRLSARRATIVLTVSEFSAREIESAFGITPPTLRVVRSGVRGVAAERGAHAREPRILFVGSIFNRRHVPALIHAVARVRRQVPGVRLSIVGENRSWPWQDPLADAKAAGVSDAVEVADYVPETRLAELYNSASVFAFVSEYEGFGLTPLEALAAGVPPVVADTPVAREVCGDAALYVPPGDILALADALMTLLLDSAARERLLACAPAVLARYSWDRAAAETWAALEEAASHGE